MLQRLDQAFGNAQTVTTYPPSQITAGSVSCGPNGSGDYNFWPYSQWPYGFYQHVVAPTDCAGDIHVFPCPHCDKCKCGGAMKAKGNKR